MQKYLSLFLLWFLFTHAASASGQVNEKICSQHYNFCFQIPPNFFMLNTNDIESQLVSYKTVDGSSSIIIFNGKLTPTTDFHTLYLMILGQWIDLNYKVTLKREYADFFIIGGYTREGRGFYQKVIKIDANYATAYLEFPKGNKKYSNISQMLFDYFQKSIID